ncbi:MAG: PKD domain-containing protein [Myxococcales bacterium]|nr:PKD domain-containing protein [Myxococcales bacterium]
MYRKEFLLGGVGLLGSAACGDDTVGSDGSGAGAGATAGATSTATGVTTTGGSTQTGTPPGLAIDLQVSHLDPSGEVQRVAVSSGVTSITVVAPAYVYFDASESRSEAPDASDKAGALLNLGFEWDSGDPVDGNDWSWGGPRGPVQKGRGRFTAREAHYYSNPGTYTMQLRVRDSAGREGSVSLTVEVLDPLTELTRVDLSADMGQWPSLASHHVYTLSGDLTGWGDLDLTGLVNVVFIPHPDSPAAPTLSGVTLDRRTEGALGETITRPRGIRFDGVDCGSVRWGMTGFDWCAFGNGRVSSIDAAFAQAYVWSQAVVNGLGAEVANNIRFPIGLLLWNTGECGGSGSPYVLFSPGITKAAYYGVDFHKSDGGGGGQVFRGRWRQSIFRHCRFRNTGPSTGYGRFEGGECREANGGVPDPWRDDGRVGDYDGGYLYGYAAEDNDITSCVMGADGASVPVAGFGAGPENNLPDFPNQGQRYCYYENIAVHGDVLGTSLNAAAFGGGLWVGARHVRFGDGTSVDIDISPNTERLPPGENGPYIEEETSSRPEPTPL